jgi:DNA polymerase-3 subunit gamma/tau
MSYTVLARKYRSKNFDELIGQDHVAKTLKRAIESGRIAHAFLFCGTRGTGKTSTARILAKALNCQNSDAPTPNPCGKCNSCLAIAAGEDMDVIEIDGASNTGVDNVRDTIIATAYNSPAHSRFKVFIIDEVHMLSKNAFNALLKILEEPPSHVKFILATTEPEKVLPTILSRCQRYDFRSISAKEIADHLQEISKKEKISADDDALAMVAKAGAGSMRDSLSLLDRLLSLGDKKLTAQNVEQMLGLPRVQLISDLVNSIGQGDVKRTLEQTDAMLNTGLSPDALISTLSDHLRNLLIARTCGQDSGLLNVPGLTDAELAAQASKFEPTTLSQNIAILEELRRTLRQSQTGRAMLDATLVRLALAKEFSSIDQLLSTTSSAPASRPASAPPEQKKNAEPLNPAPRVEMKIPEPAPPPSSPPAPEPQAKPTILEPTGDLWPDLLARLEQTASTMASTLRLASLTGIQNSQAIIRFPQHLETFAKQWSGNGKKDLIANALTDLRGESTGVRFEVGEVEPAALPAAKSVAAKPVAAPTRQPIDATIQDDPLVKLVLEEFGGRIAKVE